MGVGRNGAQSQCPTPVSAPGEGALESMNNRDCSFQRQVRTKKRSLGTMLKRLFYQDWKGKFGFLKCDDIPGKIFLHSKDIQVISRNQG